MEPMKYWTRFIELLIEHTRTYFFQTLNIVQHVCCLVIELKHPILAFVERIDIVHIDPSLKTYFIGFWILLPLLGRIESFPPQNKVSVIFSNVDKEGFFLLLMHWHWHWSLGWWNLLLLLNLNSDWRQR